MNDTSRNATENAHFTGKEVMTQPPNYFFSHLNSRGPLPSPQELDTSFQKDQGDSHSQQIWKASIAYLKACLLQEFNQQKGLNSNEIFSCIEGTDPDLLDEDETLLQKISKNSLTQKSETLNQFLVDLKAQSNLQKLLSHLYKLFHQEIFNQLCLVIHEAWEIYLKERQRFVLPNQLSKLLMHGFKNLDEIEEKPNRNKYLPMSAEEILCIAKLATEQVASVYFLSHKVKFLNLKECECKKKPERVIREEFDTFLQSVIYNMFLCLEGEIYSTDDSEKLFPAEQIRSFPSEFPSELDSELLYLQSTPNKKRQLKDQ